MTEVGIGNSRLELENKKQEVGSWKKNKSDYDLGSRRKNNALSGAENHYHILELFPGTETVYESVDSVG